MVRLHFQTCFCLCAYQEVRTTKGKEKHKSLITNEETFEGSGVLQCFGNMTVSLLVGGSEEGDGTAKCRPVFEDPDNGIPIAPQGFIADGEDGSHWVRTSLIYLNVYRFLVLDCFIHSLSSKSNIFF